MRAVVGCSMVWWRLAWVMQGSQGFLMDGCIIRKGNQPWDVPYLYVTCPQLFAPCRCLLRPNVSVSERCFVSDKSTLMMRSLAYETVEGISFKTRIFGPRTRTLGVCGMELRYFRNVEL